MESSGAEYRHDIPTRAKDAKHLDGSMTNEDREDSGICSLQDSVDQDDQSVRALRLEVQQLQQYHQQQQQCQHQQQPQQQAHSTDNLLRMEDENGDTLLHLAIIHEKPALAQQIVSSTSNTSLLEKQNFLQQTPLHLAAAVGDVALVRALAEAGVQLDVPDLRGDTPLHVACRCSQRAGDILRALALPTRPQQFQRALGTLNYRGLTCLHLSVLLAKRDVMDCVLELGADINAQELSSGRSALHLAVEAGDAMMAAALLRRGADPNVRTRADCTPLHVAAGRGDTRLAAVLVRHGADVEQENWEHETPAELALNWPEMKSVLCYDRR
ncbi:NF-kappa-B inhibitor alpha-like [Lethenteron reissneri]|uniref:NF-kappa-B inhibitor alpha-like n=1 Tax=Lethenteron reissneri TaxID=7753 RepID=UPI002AB727D2|nr:NF-kappa-B inhibitor alpha-like [Lethenteron reissneri]